jgi:hypothetical protein
MPSNAHPQPITGDGFHQFGRIETSGTLRVREIHIGQRDSFPSLPQRCQGGPAGRGCHPSRPQQGPRLHESRQIRKPAPYHLGDPANEGRRPGSRRGLHCPQCCSQCLYVSRENRKSQSEFGCCQCHYTAHADINAALVIKLLGWCQLAYGGEIRLVKSQLQALALQARVS